MTKELEALKTIKIKCHPNSNPSPIVDEALEIVEQALIRLEEFNKYITSLHRHRNRYKKLVLYDFEDEKAAIRASTIEELYNKFKEVMSDE